MPQPTRTTASNSVPELRPLGWVMLSRKKRQPKELELAILIIRLHHYVITFTDMTCWLHITLTSKNNNINEGHLTSVS